VNPARQTTLRISGHARASRRLEPTVPRHWRKELQRVLISEAALKKRIGQLAKAIARDFAGRDLVIVALLNGTVLFLADLIRQLSMPLRLDFIGVSSYGSSTEARELAFTKELRLEVRGRDVLLIDDILDTGKTMVAVLTRLTRLQPRAIKTCVLLNKPARRAVEIEADYVGFDIPDLFVVGYGLDFGERYRNLPFIGVLRPELYRLPADP
jgi:hypoxanthine phosphoribosyltransferase